MECRRSGEHGQEFDSKQEFGNGFGGDVNCDVDCTNIYMRRSKLPRTSMIGMEPDGAVVTVSGCEDEVFGDDPDVLPCFDVPVFETKPRVKNEMMVTMARVNLVGKIRDFYEGCKKRGENSYQSLMTVCPHA